MPQDLSVRSEREIDGITITMWSDPNNGDGRSVTLWAGWGEPEGGQPSGRTLSLLGEAVEVYEDRGGDDQIVVLSLNDPEVSTCIWLVVSAIGLAEEEFSQVVESVVEK